MAAVPGGAVAGRSLVRLAGEGRAPQRGRSLRGRRRPHGGRLFGRSACSAPATRTRPGRPRAGRRWRRWPSAPGRSPGPGVEWRAEADDRIVAASTCRRSGRRSTSRSTATAPCATSTPALGERGPEALGLYPVRLRGPHRAALRRPRPPGRLQRRLVVRDTALRAVLPRRARVRHRLTAAARITARGASRPVQSSNARTPWATRMSIPEATAAPWRPAAASSAVPPGR